jgi:hypothetical protein
MLFQVFNEHVNEPRVELLCSLLVHATLKLTLRNIRRERSIRSGVTKNGRIHSLQVLHVRGVLGRVEEAVVQHAQEDVVRALDILVYVIQRGVDSPC